MHGSKNVNPPGNYVGSYFCKRLSRPQPHSAAGKIMCTKNSSGTIGNRTRDLPAGSAVPQPTAPQTPSDVDSRRAICFPEHLTLTTLKKEDRTFLGNFCSWLQNWKTFRPYKT